MFQNLKVRLGLIAGLTVLSILAFIYKPITLGLDLQGGAHYAMEIDESRAQLTPAARRDAVDRALKVVRLRVDELGVSEPVVQKAGEDRIIVELAGDTNQSRAKEVLQKSAFLEFKIVRPLTELQGLLLRMEQAIAAAYPSESRPAGAPAGNTAGGLLQTKTGQDSTKPADSLTTSRPLESKFAGQGSGGQILIDTAQVATVQKYLALPQVQALLPRGAQFLWGMPSAEDQKGFASLWYVNRDAIMTGEHLQNAQAQTDQFNRPIVAFELSRRAGRRFEKETGDHLHEQMAIVLDDRVYTAPVINGAINTRGQIELGKASMEDASDLALVLRAGALPAPLHIVEERSVGPSLGDDSIRNGKLAALVGIGAVIL
ncbi:MAG TPA: hypothetical protein VF771_10025, partial [Longimicrobiaceae bacterium]